MRLLLHRHEYLSAAVEYKLSKITASGKHSFDSILVWYIVHEIQEFTMPIRTRGRNEELAEVIWTTERRFDVAKGDAGTLPLPPGAPSGNSATRRR